MNRSLIRYLRLILLPFSWLYGLIIYLRHILYDSGVLRRTDFDLPVIVIGNLEVGGTGKTPMAEYLIRLLKDSQQIAVLSRGYGRRSRGYLEVHTDTTSEQSGDEPLQIKQKFPEITVTVCESRVEGVDRLHRDHDIILLDDAFQHRALQPTGSILLFNYHSLSWRFLLPAGNYRDIFSARKRANVLVVTKCPPDLGPKEKEAIRRKLAVPGQDIPVLFSSIVYGALAPVSGSAEVISPKLDMTGQQVLLVTGIARPQPLLELVEHQAAGVMHLAYPDHHRFSDKDLQDIQRGFEELSGPQKIILTTEKDAKRLTELPANLPLYYLPIRHEFHGNDASHMEEIIKQMVRIR